MSIKGTVDPMFFGSGEASLIRDNGGYVTPGWYCVDDNNKRIDGPYHSRKSCQRECDRINGD